MGGDVMNFSLEAMSVTVVWDQSNAENVLDMTETNGTKNYSHLESFIAAINCLLLVQKNVVYDDHFLGIVTAASYGEIILQVGWPSCPRAVLNRACHPHCLCRPPHCPCHPHCPL